MLQRIKERNVGNIQEWSRRTYGPSPWEVRLTLRFLGMIRNLELVGHEGLIAATVKHRVANMLISRILRA